MYIFLKRYKYILLAFVGVALCLVGSISFKKVASSREVPLASIGQGSFWEGEIKSIGGAAAYEELVSAVAQLDPNKRHGDAHVFGRALYRSLGLSGISVCDTRLSSGCFHEFVGQAIRELGLSSVRAIDENCTGAMYLQVSCQHGEGHGLVGYLGYDDSALTKALDVCRGLKKVDSLSGCSAGVFMEYNLRTMIDKGEPRAFSEPHDMIDWLFPCDTLTSNLGLPVSRQELKSCALMLPQWWFAFNGFTTPWPQEHPEIYYKDLFVEMGKRCKTIGKGREVESVCFEGIGQQTPVAADYDPRISATLCDMSSAYKPDTLLCRAGAANLFNSIVSVAEALLVCDDLSGAAKAYCDSYARADVNISNGPILGPETN